MKKFGKFFVLVLFVLLCLPFSAKAATWHAENITLSNISISNNNMVLFDISFDLPSDLGSATCWIGLQTEEFDEGDSHSYGDFTDMGNVAETYHFGSLSSITSNTDFVNQYGIKGFAPNNDTGFPAFWDNTHIEQTLSVDGLPLDTTSEYRVYLWTFRYGYFYPDAYLGKITVDGNGNFDIVDSTNNSGTIVGYYKVNFNTNGGTDVVSQTVAENEKVTKPSDPTKDGYAFDSWCSDVGLSFEYDFDTLVTSDLFLHAKWRKVYKILDENPKEYELNSNVNISFTADGNISNIDKILVDDAELDSQYYELASGSTILTLLSDYLDTLSTGSHKITFKYTDASVDATLNVVAANTNTNTNTNNNTNSNTNTNTNTNTPTTNTNTSTTTNTTNTSTSTNTLSNPKTGDNIVLYATLLMLSIGGLTITGLCLKKNTNRC